MAISACGSRSEIDGDAGDQDAATCGKPPTPATGTPASNGSTLVYAVDTLFMGDMDVDGTFNPNAWTATGYDLDRVDTIDKSTASCASIEYNEDGACGIDNAFGSLAFEGFVSNRSRRQTALATSGRWTWLIEVKNFVSSGTFTGLTVRAHVGAPLGFQPRFDGSDTWSPAVGLDSSEAIASVSNNVIVAGALDMWMDEPLSDQASALHRLHMPLHATVIRMVLSADLQRVTSGLIAGVIDPNEIVGAFLPCTPQNWNFQSASDVHRGLQNDPTTACDAWSFAIAFTATRAHLGPPAPPLPPPTDCKSP